MKWAGAMRGWGAACEPSGSEGPSRGTEVVSAQLWLGNVLVWSGRAEEALAPHEIAATLDPLSPLGYSVAITLHALRRWNESRTHRFGTERSVSPRRARGPCDSSRPPRASGSPRRRLRVSREWAALAGYAQPTELDVVGRAMLDPSLHDSARAVLLRLDAAGVFPRDPAELHVALGDTDKAIALLTRAFDDGDPVVIQLGVDPTFDPLRDNPRFILILDVLRLPHGGPVSTHPPA